MIGSGVTPKSLVADTEQDCLPPDRGTNLPTYSQTIQKEVKKISCIKLSINITFKTLHISMDIGSGDLFDEFLGRKSSIFNDILLLKYCWAFLMISCPGIHKKGQQMTPDPVSNSTVYLILYCLI